MQVEEWNAAQVRVFSTVQEQDSQYFGPGGSRRGTHHDDCLRAAYLGTRSALLAKQGRVLLDNENGLADEYTRLRGQLLRRGFSKRRTNREIVSTGLEEEEGNKEEEQETRNALFDNDKKKPAASVVLRPKRYKVAEEYAFTGFHRIFDHHQTSVTRMSFANGDRSQLAMCCADGSVSIARTDRDGNEKTIAGATMQFRLARFPKLKTGGENSHGAAIDLAWSASNDWLLVGYAGGHVVLYETKTLRAIRVLQTDSVSCVRFDPNNGNYFLVGTRAGSVKLYNASTGQVVHSLRLGSANVSGVSSFVFDSSGDYIWVGLESGMILSYFKHSLLEETIVLKGKPINSLSFHAWIHRRVSIRELLVSSPNSDSRAPTTFVIRLDSNSGKMLTKKKSATFRVQNKGLVLRSVFCPLTPSSRDGACIVCASEDGGVRIFDIVRCAENRNPLINNLVGHNAPVLDVCWSFDETLLASSDLTGTVLVWKRQEIELQDEETE